MKPLWYIPIIPKLQLCGDKIKL